MMNVKFIPPFLEELSVGPTERGNILGVIWGEEWKGCRIITSFAVYY